MTTEERFGDRMDLYREALIADLQALVRIPSVRGAAVPGKPFGTGPWQALQQALDLGRSWGMGVHNEHGYAGHVEIGNGTPLIGVLVHLDVVPEGSGWTVPPYSAVIRENRIIGRGVSDNKGPAVAALYALKALKDAAIPLRKRIRVILGCSEETGMEDMAWYFSHQQLPDLAFVPDAGYPAINREKGIMRFECTTHCASGVPCIMSVRGGDALNKVPDWCEAHLDALTLGPARLDALRSRVKETADTGAKLERTGDGSLIVRTSGVATHGAAPELGINAIARMASLLSGIDSVSASGRMLQFIDSWIGADYRGTTLGIACSDAESGPLSLNIGTIEGSSTVCTVQLDIRHPVTSESSRIEELMIHAGKQASVDITVGGRLAPLRIASDHPLILSLRKAYKIQTGTDPDPVACSGGTYARTLKGRGVAFGGTGGNGHQSDEYVDIDDLMLHARICAQAVYELATQP